MMLDEKKHLWGYIRGNYEKDGDEYREIGP